MKQFFLVATPSEKEFKVKVSVARREIQRASFYSYFISDIFIVNFIPLNPPSKWEILDSSVVNSFRMTKIA